MSVIFVDGCNNYTGVTDSLMKWSALGCSTVLSGGFFPLVRAGVRHIELNQGTIYQVAGAQEDATFILKSRICRNTNGDLKLVFMSDSANTTHVTIQVSNTGQIQAFRGTAAGALLGTTDPNVIAALVWRHLEIKVVLDAAAGSVVIRLDGNATPVLNITGVNTKNGGTKTKFDSFELISDDHAGYCDIVLMNTAGAVNNDFTGDSIIDTLLPTAAGTTTGLTPTGSGTNYQNVNSVPAVDIAYNASPTTTTFDTYLLTQSTAGAGATVAAVVVNNRAFKDTTDSAGVAPMIRTHAANFTGTEQTVALNPALYRQYYETNPSTSAAWTIAEVNAMEAGPKVLIP